MTAALALGVACSYEDVGGRIPVRSFQVSSLTASPLRIVLVPDDCPSERVVIDAAVTGPATRHAADVACLGRLAVGSTVRHERQKQRQGCMPGAPQYDLVGDCALGPLTLTSSGTRCTRGSRTP